LDDKNCIAVEILNIDDSKIERFKYEANDSKAITFVASDGFSTDEATFPGQHLSNGGGSSIGYKAQRYLGNNDWEYGFVTAGHAIMRFQNATQQNNIIVGTCTDRKYDGALDAAFVRTNSGYTTSRYTLNGYYISGSWTVPAVNSTVYKEGSSTGWTSGKVISNSTNQTISGIFCTDILSANYNSLPGDSGGIVYTPSGSVVGIHKAGPTGGGTGTRYVVKAGNISAYLNVQPN
jgi:hypothetical protein